MKNLLLLLVVALFASFGVNSQTAMTVSDTITNTGTEYATLQVKSSGSIISIQAVVTKLSGTVAGTVILQASNDGLNYVTIGSDTLTLSNVTTNSYLFTVSNHPYIYYRLKATGSGTMSATLKGWLVRRDL